MGFRSWLERKRARFDRGRKPEAYWVERRERIVGYGDLEEIRSCRQLETFEVVIEYLGRHGVQQVADLGSNFSLFGQLLRDRGYEDSYIAVENNPHALIRARQALEKWPGDTHLINANIRDLPFEDREIECCFMKDVLEHMEDFTDVFQEAARVSDRALIIGAFLPWTDEAPHYEKHRRGFYLNRYRRRDVVDFASTLGFAVKETTPTKDSEGKANEVVIFERQ